MGARRREHGLPRRILHRPWDASLDAGYAWCGTADGDAYRFGKSVIRKTGSDGKLIDSNNSTNDFESNTKASLIK